ncbi:branched-chain amino acid ABC transporter permease [Natronosalvus amylolyticus]|uniref:branched-chain amino acid ABC transporter permease n=1 Tax=Natronosalvus amylolyticus TaxID=2961994 RepID=UPI0020C9ADB0|nr:branched-chain amino acid ABC transporter permease [Natronosalvus amylolyticus]
MVDVVTIAVNAVLLSALYALVAIGFTMIFGIAEVLNVAHGANITIGGFSAYFVWSVLDLSIWIGAIAALIIPGIFSLIVYKYLIKPIEDDPTMVVILTLAVLLVVEYAFRTFVGDTARAIPSLLPGQTEIAGLTLQNNRVFVFLLSWALIIGLILFINRTWTGQAIEAVGMNRRGAALAGIDQHRITLYTWFIAGMLAGIAGLFFGSFQSVSWEMGLDPLLLSFTIVILGGIGSIKGSVVGAYIIGTLETLTVTLIDARLAGAASLIVLFFVLIAMPQGLYGRAEVE